MADRTESNNKFGRQTFIGIIESNLTNNEQRLGILEMILSPMNLNMASKKVKSNKGSGGVDGLSVKDLLPYLLEHKDSLIDSIIQSTYRPSLVRRVEIPKKPKKTRPL